MESRWRLSILAFIHGVMIVQILNELGIDDTKENRIEVKEMLKKHCHIDSLGNLTAIELRVFVNRVIMIMARDFSIELSDLGNPLEDNENVTLEQFFHLIYDNN